MELNNNVHAFNSSRYVHVRYRRSIALSCPNEASRFETSPIQLCASKFRLKKEYSVEDLAFHFSNLASFSNLSKQLLHPFSLSLSLSRERIESSDSFGSGSLSRFLPFYRDYYYKFVSSLIEMIFEFCYSRPVLSNLLFRVFRSRILLWDVNWKNLREGTNTNRNFSFHISHDAIKMERWTRKGRLIYHDLAS